MAGVKPRVAVLAGGPSAEREVSLTTGSEIHKALGERGYRSELVDFRKDIVAALSGLDCDLVFIALHGSPGEDGTVQGVLELLGIPYVGSGVLASALGMDKLRSKLFFAAMGIPSPFYLPLERRMLEDQSPQEVAEVVMHSLDLPIVVKPASEGSAIGITVVRDRSDLSAAVGQAFEHGREVLVEEYVEGREVTVAVLGNDGPRTLPAVEVETSNEFYDYEAKYTPGVSRHVIPARIPEKTAEQIAKFAQSAHEGLGCRCFSRTDFIVDSDGIAYALEINTIPGLTPVSLFPDAARAAGIEFPDLIDRLVKLALED